MQAANSVLLPLKSFKICLPILAVPRSLHFSSANRSIIRPWTSNELRDTFIQYFQQKDHTLVPSSPVIPKHDASLLFVNAGMNQFKPIFLAGNVPSSLGARDSFILPDGSNMLNLERAVNSQKCIRLSGKHNDFDEVGKNYRHHTFFEMLGNWAFNGAYFKKEACAMAWDLLLNVFRLNPNRLLITYFGGDAQIGITEDEDTRRIWLDLGVPKERIIHLPASENFWEMGNCGPCGVCTEIHFIMDENYAKKLDQKLIGLRSSCLELRQLQLNALSKSLEIWNLVFMQYNKTEQGTLEKLPEFHVDTGMGFERILSVLNGRQSNYDTDLFLPLFDHIHKETKYEHNPAYSGSLTSDHDIAYRIIADHIRAIVISVSDGCTPSKTDAGFCLRKLIRRVHILIRNQFQQKNSLHLMRILADQVIESLGTAYPNLGLQREQIQKVISEEIQNFQSKLKAAKKFVKQLNIDFQGLSDEKFISGLDALRIQKRFGLSPETIEQLATTSGFKVDWVEFDRLVKMDHEKTLQGQMRSNVK